MAEPLRLPRHGASQRSGPIDCMDGAVPSQDARVGFHARVGHCSPPRPVRPGRLHATSDSLRRTYDEALPAGRKAIGRRRRNRFLLAPVSLYAHHLPADTLPKATRVADMAAGRATTRDLAGRPSAGHQAIPRPSPVGPGASLQGRLAGSDTSALRVRPTRGLIDRPRSRTGRSGVWRAPVPTGRGAIRQLKDVVHAAQARGSLPMRA